MSLSVSQIQKKYGYELTWEDGQASGTNFSRSHKPELIDRLKRGVEGACKRQRIAGPARVCIMGQPRRDKTWFTSYGAMHRVGGFGRILSPIPAPGDQGNKLGSFWDDTLTDALWDAVVCIDQPYPTPEVRFTLKALRLPTIDTLIEFLDNFVADGVYTATVSLEGYWLEDETLPSLPKVHAWNAGFGALNAGRRHLSTPNPEAFQNDPNPTRLREFLEWVWTTVAGYGPVPGGWSDEDFFMCFWMHTLSRGVNRYCVAHGLNWEGLSRNVEDGAGNIQSWGNNRMEGWDAVSFVQIKRDPVTREWSWDQGSNRGTTTQYPDGSPVSVLAIGKLKSPIATPGFRAVAIHPVGQNTVMLPWQDPAIYNVQSVQESLSGMPARFRVVENAFAPGSYSQFRGNPLPQSAWNHSHNGAIKSRGLPETRFRVHKVGTPYVGPLSPWAMKSLRNKGLAYDGFFAE